MHCIKLISNNIQLIEADDIEGTLPMGLFIITIFIFYKQN